MTISLPCKRCGNLTYVSHKYVRCEPRSAKRRHVNIVPLMTSFPHLDPHPNTYSLIGIVVRSLRTRLTWLWSVSDDLVKAASRPTMAEVVAPLVALALVGR